MKILLFLILVFFFIFAFLVRYSLSLPLLFITEKNCTNTFNSSCYSTTLDDALLGCNGTQIGAGDRIAEVHINQSTFLQGSGINATCDFYLSGISNNSLYLWYYNGSVWYNVWNNENYSVGVGNFWYNTSINFTLNSSSEMQIIRCIAAGIAGSNPSPTVSSECANSTTTSSTRYDNDDVNFTVTDYPKYDNWNINVSDYTEVNRSDFILAYAHWDKNIFYAKLRHNGTGSFENYTISSYEGNWTNYTLNISNRTEFSNAGVIEISYIWANDTYGLENYTSTSHYFNLSAGNAPNVTNFWFNYSGITTNKTNKYTNLTIYANVSDDVGLSTVIANITYPGLSSINATMSRYSSGTWEIWNYSFGTDLHLNTTGNYTVRIIARDIGGQEKASGVDYPLENMTFNVTNNYTLNLTSNYSIYNRGENVTIQALDVNILVVDNVNWTANVTKINETYNFTVNQTTLNYTILPSDPEGNYSIIANASKNNNTGNNTWQFNVSKNLTLVISTSSTLSPGNLVIFSVSMYNARGELYNGSVDANITCNSGSTWNYLTFSSGYASKQCTIPSSYSTNFNVTVNVSDAYNNTGENYTTYRTTDAPSSGGLSSGGGGFATETKKCSDNTTYNSCSLNRPLYCSNGKLINKCSVCKCEAGYACNSNESCVLIKEEDFNFETNITSIEMRQGEDKEFVIGTLKNTGNIILNLKTFLDIAQDCCNVSMPSTIQLEEKEEKGFDISIHVPLTANVSEYLAKIGIGTSAFKKERSFTIAVSRSPVYTSLADIESEILNIEKEIQEYKNAGVDVSSLESMLEQAKLKLYNANNSVNSDQLNVLTGYISEIAGDMSYIQSGLSSIRNRLFFSQLFWLVLLLAISSLVTIYTVPEVLMPLYRIEKEVRQLKEEEKILVSSRLETEKQYFLRKIDENTFSKIMIGKQDKILKTRATIKEKEDENKKIIETRLKPRGIARTIKEKFNKVFKKKNEK